MQYGRTEIKIPDNIHVPLKRFFFYRFTCLLKYGDKSYLQICAAREQQELGFIILFPVKHNQKEWFDFSDDRPINTVPHDDVGRHQQWVVEASHVHISVLL